MKRFSIICFLTYGLVTIAISQNKSEYFKTVPNIPENTPEWVQLMYSPDPNVFEVDELREEYYRKNAFQKNLHTQNYKHWRRIVENYIDEQGLIRPMSPQEEEAYFKELKDKKSQQHTARSSSQNWTNIGPVETYKRGTLTPMSSQANVMSLDQSTSHPDILYAGTEAGGVYKTIDKGLNWSLVSQNEAFLRVTAVQIHPTNPNNVLVCGDSKIYQSLDGGSTWIRRAYIDAVGHELKFHPTDPSLVYCANSTSLLKSTDGGFTWAVDQNKETWDVDFHPTNPNIIYILIKNARRKRAEVFRSNNKGVTWALKGTGWYIPTDLANAKTLGGKLAIPPSSPNMIYACLIGESKAGDHGWIGVYKSINRGNNWTNPSGQDGGPYGPINSNSDWNVAAYRSGYHQGFYNFDLEVSPTNPNKLWVGTIRLATSNDGGATFSSIGGLSHPGLHADIQALEVNRNDIWIASDGGIGYSNDGLASAESRKKGITASSFWGFGSGWNQDVLIGGRYHNGNAAYYQTYGLGNFHKINGVEEATGYVNPMRERKVYSGIRTNTFVSIIPDVLGGNIQSFPRLPLRATESPRTGMSSGIYFDPRYADHLLLGKDNHIYKSTDGGSNFNILKSFRTNSKVFEIAISRANPDVIYAVVFYNNINNIYKTVNGGRTWARITNPPTNNLRKLIITLNPSNANDIWVACISGANGRKIYRSTNGGSTWVNKTTSTLNNERIEDIYYQGGTTDGVYLATFNKVFYWSNTANNWVDCDANLPLIAKSLKFGPFYKEGKMRLATKGRGIFEREFVNQNFLPVAQPITYTNVIACSQDTVPFDCHSMLKHNGASWEWIITPSPAYISSTSVRNPKVVFGNSGNYDVTLRVTDANGNIDSKTINQMISVTPSSCDPISSTPSKALRITSPNSFLKFPNDDINNTELKIEQKEEESLIIYPNPLESGGELTIKIADNKKGRLQIFKASGKLVKDIILNESQTIIKFPELTAGLYFYIFETTTKLKTGKLIIR